MRPAICLSILLTRAMTAQQVVAPTPEPVGRARGQDWEGYNFVNSFEFGYRFHEVNGNVATYRSDVNYRNGLRLLGSNFSVNSKNGQGHFFDEITLTTQGLGSDPYQSSMLRIQKNKLYRYDMLWRANDYYNPGLTNTNGNHFMDTTRTLQDHDFVFLPQSKVQFRAGYTRNSQYGPELSTVQLFDSSGNEFGPFANVRRLRREFRLGNDIELAGFKLSWLHGWDNFKEDTPYVLGASPGLNPGNRTTLDSFTRNEPIHGNSPYWRANLRKDAKTWAVNGRFTYVGGRRNFVMDENAIGQSRTAINREILVTGNARRPVIAGDFSVSVFPTTRLTVVNNSSAHSTRIDGDSVYNEFNNATRQLQILYFQFLGIRTVTNSTDLNYRVSNWLTLDGGFHYSTRLIRSMEDFNIPPFGGDNIVAHQDNHVRSGVAGIRMKPAKPLTITLDAQISRADHPFTPISERNFHALGARVQYKAKTVLLSASYRENYDTNSIAVSVHSSHARNYSYNASWTPHSWLAVDAGYTKLHLDTVSGIDFFAAGNDVSGNNSIYISNIHSGNLGLRLGLRKYADLYLGYSINRDTGDGRAAPVPAGTANPVALLLGPVQTFPLNFESPLARLSVRLSNRLRWNAGWQFYHYREDFQLFLLPQNYRAHTGYTSVLWSF